VKLRWRGGRRTASASVPLGGAEHDELDDLEDGFEDPAGDGQPLGEARPTGGPVMLTLTTREQVEKAAAAAAEPKMIRVRPGRGAFGGTASSGGCAHPHH
jgi:hypothetical protein